MRRMAVHLFSPKSGDADSAPMTGSLQLSFRKLTPILPAGFHADDSGPMRDDMGPLAVDRSLGDSDDDRFPYMHTTHI